MQLVHTPKIWHISFNQDWCLINLIIYIKGSQSLEHVAHLDWSSETDMSCHFVKSEDSQVEKSVKTVK